ncbi:MAG: Abi family protein [Bernardetiaceae bacterium]
MKKTYSKKSLNIEQQIKHIKNNKFEISDKDVLYQFLSVNPYQRIQYYFSKTPNATTSCLINIYEFDAELKTTLFRYLSKIEISLRAALTNYVCQDHGAYWISDESFFFGGYVSKNIGSIKSNVESEKKKKHSFISKHYEKYDNFPPVWKVVEVLSFSLLSKIYSSLDTQKVVSKRKITTDVYGIPVLGDRKKSPEDILSSWLHAISNLRNICYHYEPLWGRNLNVLPYLPKPDGKLSNDLWTPSGTSKKAYVVLCSIRYLMNNIDSKNTLSMELVSLSDRYGLKEQDLHKYLDFEKRWHHQPLWAQK